MKKINQKELHEIFISLRNKKQEAYNQLYEKYYKLVYGIVFSIIKNKDDTEDIVHEIFTKIYNLDSSKLPTNNEASWLFAVCKNECFLFFRKQRPNINIDEITEITKDESEIDEIIDKDYYYKLISKLKEDEKLIVSLKVISNFTFKKISQVMNIPIGTVQWKYYKAMNSLKISLGSLAGAIVSFVIVCARAEFWKQKNYLENYNNIEEQNIEKDEIECEEQSSSSENLIAEDSSSIKTEINNENSNLANIEEKDKNQDITVSQVAESNKFNDFLSQKDNIQITSLVVGIMFLIIFLIFFKNYQQKFKRKTSK